MVVVWRLFGDCVEVAWKLSGGCLGPVWRLFLRLFGVCMEVVWRLLGGCFPVTINLRVVGVVVVGVGRVPPLSLRPVCKSKDSVTT